MPSPSCATCSAIASDKDWSALPLVRVMGPSEVRPLVTRWMARAIEIRRCGRCGRNVARMAPAAP